MKRSLSTVALLTAVTVGLVGCDAQPAASTSTSATSSAGSSAAGNTAGSSTAGSSGSAATTAASGVPGPTYSPAGCAGTDGGKLRIGLVVPNLQALFFNQIVTGTQTVADAAGVDLQVISANDDSVAQSTAIDNLVTSGVQAIVVSAIDTEGVKPAIERAAGAGIKIVAVDGIVTDDAVSAQVGTSNEASGGEIGQYLAKAANNTGTVGIVGALNSTIQLERQKGFVDAITAAGMTEGPVVDGKNVQETAQSAAENLLTGNPDLAYVYATGEPALIGLVAAVTNQDAAKRASVVGWDLSEAAVEGLNAGFVKAVVQQNTFEFGYRAAAAAIDLSCGKTVEKEIPIATQIVTPDNVADFAYYLQK